MKVPFPDSKYEIQSLTTNETDAVFLGIFKSTHKGEGGPVPPSDPPKSFEAWYSYTLQHDKEGKI